MSDIRRIINLDINVEESYRGVIVNGAWKQPSSILTLYRGTQALLRLRLFMADAIKQFTPDPASTWLLGIDNAYTADKADLVISDNTQFNLSGDWDGTDGLNVAQGRICCRVNLATADLKAALASAAYQKMYASLWMFPPAGDPVLMAEWDVTIHNVAVDPTTAVAIPGVVHETSEHAQLTYVPRSADQARARYVNGDWYHYCADTELWHPIVLKKIDGIVVSTPGEGIVL